MFAYSEVGGLYYEAKFAVSEVTSGLIQGFPCYNGGLLFNRLNFTVTCAEHPTPTGGYVRNKRSTDLKSPPTDQSDQSVFLENGTPVHKRSSAAWSGDLQRVLHISV